MARLVPKKWSAALALLLTVAGGAAADEEPDLGRRARPLRAGDLCEVADSNLALAMTAILDGKRPATTAAPRPARWDRRLAPEWLDRFERRFTLTAAERQLLYRQGFVVPARLGFPSYTHAFHEVYQSQLPIYVSADAILHAVYAVNDALVADLERKLALPRLGRVVSALRGGLRPAAASYPPAVAHDLDVYLTVAARLLGDKSAAALAPTSDGEAAALVARTATGELAEVELFGRRRLIDFSQYAPRGHYAGDAELSRLFQAAMWLSRLELNLVSRSSRSSQPGATPDPSETPREATVALALADLAGRTGALADIGELDRLWSLLAGRREDVSLPQLQALRQEASITDLRQPDVAERLRRAIGDRFQRTTALHPMPEGTTTLPAIATLLGPRVVPDAAAIRPLVNTAVAGRYRVGVADLAYALGHDRALTYLGDELRRFPTLHEGLAAARRIVATAPPAGESADLYGAWLAAVRGLAERPAGQLPSFMEAPAFADLRLGSVVAAYAQLKHNYVLVAGQSYEFGGCEIPDGYVEPVPAVYQALIDYAGRGERALAGLDPGDVTHGRAYFARLGRVLRVLAAIVEGELAGRPLSPAARRFLSMVVELTPGSTGGPPTYTGWYFDLFRVRDGEGLAAANLVADYYTSQNLHEAAYAGVSGVDLGLFVVDSGGRPRLAVGPVARAYELHRPFGPASPRLDDKAAAELPEAERRAPWRAAYTAPPPPPMKALTVSYSPDESPDITIEAPAAVGPVLFTLLDHHRAPLASLTRDVPAGKTVLRFPARGAGGRSLLGAAVGGLSVRQGERFEWAEVRRTGGETGLYLSVGEAP